MNGLGFYIWKLENMPEPVSLATFLKSGGVKWVSIKVLDGIKLYNAENGNQKLLKSYYEALNNAGISAGGWQYVYGDQPGLEGEQAEAFWEEFKVPHFFIDAESEYKIYGASKAAKTYCDKLHNGQVDIYLSSYRFPSKHGGLKPFPFSAFLNHDKVDGTAPQIYWIGVHNPEAQLEQSYNEYRNLTDKPFVPIGSSFGEGTWNPTVNDLKKFVSASRRFNAWGFWSLDWILKNRRTDWWDAITGGSSEPEPSPEVPEKVMVTVSKLNLRNSPVVNDNTVIGVTYLNKVWYPDGIEKDSSNRIWYYFGSKKKIYLASWLTKKI